VFSALDDVSRVTPDQGTMSDSSVPTLRQARDIMNSHNLKVAKELGRARHGVFLAHDANGTAVACKIWVGDTHDNSSKKVFDRRGQIENEIDMLSGPLKGCPGVPCFNSFKSPLHIVACFRPVGQTLENYLLPVDLAARECVSSSGGGNLR